MTLRAARPAWLAVLLAIASALVGSGCGTPREVRVHGRKLELKLDEYRIVPARVRVHAGRLKLVVHNTGVLTHNLKIETGSIDSNGNPVVVASVPTTQPGQTATVKVDLPAGHYRMLCTLANHADLGQRGTLTVG